MRRPFPCRWLAVAIAAGLAGCDSAPPQPVLDVTASTVRASRRLYDGAPPVIPHAPLNIQCIACHTDTGKEAPPLGFAPANPHGRTEGLSATSNCQQCHVFQREKEVFAESDFEGLAQTFVKADRLYPGAPPVIPHRVFMRENCLSCHSGPVARPEIRCTHPQRTHCRQCHVPVTEPSEPLDATSDIAEGLAERTTAPFH
jgi:nitrate reductase cytochrome c-type subunit